jgi:hydroxyacylglutathione hydrolase
MTIITNTGGLAATNCFLVADDQTKEAVLFDAPNDTVAPLLDEAAKRGYRIIGLWLTHGHFDHIADHAMVTKRFPDAKVLIHPLDEPKLKQPHSRFFPLPFVIPARSADGYFADGQKLKIGSLELEVIHTPGHAPGHVMFYFPKEQVVIGGDLIIMNAVGRTDLPDSEPALLNRSIRRVMQLPGATRLLPGHGHPTTLEEERMDNPYVRAALAEG